MDGRWVYVCRTDTATVFGLIETDPAILHHTGATFGQMLPIALKENVNYKYIMLRSSIKLKFFFGLLAHVLKPGPTLYTRPNDSSKGYPRGANWPPPKRWSHLGGVVETSSGKNMNFMVPHLKTWLRREIS